MRTDYNCVGLYFNPASSAHLIRFFLRDGEYHLIDARAFTDLPSFDQLIEAAEALFKVEFDGCDTLPKDVIGNVPKPLQTKLLRAVDDARVLYVDKPGRYRV